MSGDNLMPIGQFSKCCRLSIKALRHYDELGLLKPAMVDSSTGYRYYARHQARDAVLIGMLRELDVPLASICTLLHCEGDEFRRLLAEERQRIARELAAKQQALRSIERLSQAGRLLPYDVALRDEPDYTVARMSCFTRAERILDDSGPLVYRLIDALRAAGRELQDPVMCINEDPDRDERILVHACVGVHRPLAPIADVDVVDLPGGPVAFLLHRGPYEELGIAYHALFAWTQQRGHVQRAAMREIYLNDPAEVDAQDLLTEVILPVQA